MASRVGLCQLLEPAKCKDLAIVKSTGGDTFAFCGKAKYDCPYSDGLRYIEFSTDKADETTTGEERETTDT